MSSEAEPTETRRIQHRHPYMLMSAQGKVRGQPVLSHSTYRSGGSICSVFTY